MTSENETVEDIAKELRDEPLAENGAKPWLHYLSDRVEAAHKREIAVMEGERNGILKANESLAADNTRLRGEVAELRECLDAAIFCYKICKHCLERGWKCDTCGIGCIVHGWLKVMKGEK